MANKNIKKITPEAMENLALELIEYFAKNELWQDMGIYVNNKRLASDNIKNSYKEAKTKGGVVYYIEEDVDVTKQIEYNNPETLTLYFEGPLYDMINHIDYDYTSKLDEMFLKPYGLYFEQGYAWSMAAYN